MRDDRPQPEGSLKATIETILDDRLCASCGYSLKGLNAGGDCPECGEPCITSAAPLGVRPQDDADFSRSSWHFLLVLGIGLLMCGVSGVFVTRFAHIVLVGATDAREARLGLAGATMWVIALLILQRDRPRAQQTKTTLDDHAPWYLRLGVMLTQPAWIAAAAMTHLELTGATGATAGKWIAVLIAAAGAPLVPWTISYIAEWIGSGTTMNWLRNAAWCLAFGFLVLTPVQLLWATGMKWTSLLAFPAGTAHVLWIIGLVGTSLLSLQLLIDVRWAIVNARERAASDLRRIERDRRYAASLPQATYVEPEPVIATELDRTTPDETNAPAPATFYRSPDEVYIEPLKDGVPYPLEDSNPIEPPDIADTTPKQ